MPARTTRPQRRPARRVSSGYASSFPSRVDFECVLGPPLQANPAASGLERLLGGRLEVLLDHGQLAARVQVDDVPREHPGVDDVADPARLDRVAAGGLLV